MPALKSNPCDVLIFDGSNAAHRLSAAMQPLTNSKGQRVEVVFGLLRLIAASLKENPASECWVCWDGRGSKALRQKRDPLYKAHRGKDLDDATKVRLESMHEQVHRFWEQFGQYLPLNWVESSVYEADDLMAMLALRQLDKYTRTTIVTGDKDLLQLVSDRVSVFSPNRQALITPENFAEITGGYPGGFFYLLGKCLQGDSSDNIPGAPKVGEKTAFKILQQHDFDLPRLLHYPEKDFLKTAVGKLFNTPEVHQRVQLNFSLMSLLGALHENGFTPKVQKTLTHKVGKFNSMYVKQYMAKNQFGSLLMNFNSWVKVFQKLEV